MGCKKKLHLFQLLSVLNKIRCQAFEYSLLYQSSLLFLLLIISCNFAVLTYAPPFSYVYVLKLSFEFDEE